MRRLQLPGGDRYLPGAGDSVGGVGGFVKKEIDKNEGNEKELQHGSPLKNIGRIIFLIVVLVAAWFILDKLIGH